MRNMRADRGAHAADARVEKDAPPVLRSYGHTWRVGQKNANHETPDYAVKNRAMFALASEYMRYKAQASKTVKKDV